MHTGDAGHTTFADVEIPGPPVIAEGVRNHWLPDVPATTVNIIELLERRPKLEPHPPPRRQWVVILRGAMEISTRTGERRRFERGDCLLAEDMSGTGHETWDVGDEHLVTLNIGVPASWRCPGG
jgi:hypothetical protein